LSHVIACRKSPACQRTGGAAKALTLTPIHTSTHTHTHTHTHKGERMSRTGRGSGRQAPGVGLMRVQPCLAHPARCAPLLISVGARAARQPGDWKPCACHRAGASLVSLVPWPHSLGVSSPRAGTHAQAHTRAVTQGLKQKECIWRETWRSTAQGLRQKQPPASVPCLLLFSFRASRGGRRGGAVLTRPANRRC